MDYHKTLFANKVASSVIGGQIAIQFGTLFPTDSIIDNADTISPWAIGFENKDLRLIDETIVYIDKRTAAQLYLNLKYLVDRGVFSDYLHLGNDVGDGLD